MMSHRERLIHMMFSRSLHVCTYWHQERLIDTSDLHDKWKIPGHSKQTFAAPYCTVHHGQKSNEANMPGGHHCARYLRRHMPTVSLRSAWSVRRNFPEYHGRKPLPGEKDDGYDTLTRKRDTYMSGDHEIYQSVTFTDTTGVVLYS